MIKNIYRKCDCCGKDITVANYARLYIACTDPNSHLNRTKFNYRLDHESLDCKFCGKSYKNKSGLAQHENCCKLNPNRVSRVKTSRVKTINYVYKEHNDSEISKWLNYLRDRNFSIPNYDIIYYKSVEYPIAKGIYKKTQNGLKYQFVHDLIADILLDGNLSEVNTVHHINKLMHDNCHTNLLVFVDGNHHKRFHNSNYAYLTYDSKTHLFSCEIKHI